MQCGTIAAHGLAGSRLQTTLPSTDQTRAHHIDRSLLVVYILYLCSYPILSDSVLILFVDHSWNRNALPAIVSYSLSSKHEIKDFDILHEVSQKEVCCDGNIVGGWVFVW